MKLRLIFAALSGLLVTAAAAAPLIVTNVGFPDINCVFNTNCAVTVTDTTSPIVLSNSTGSGVLQTRTFLGETGSVAAGLYAYLYRIDLTGITANTNAEPCQTNEVRCHTNSVVTTTNRLVCQTNSLPASNRLVCVTNTVAATNIVFRFTNSIPATNFVRCTTNNAGASFCVTNFFPGTNLVLSFTNRLQASNIVDCTTVTVPATNVVTCVSNRFSVTNRVVECTTNTVACPGTAPCVDALTLRFGTPVSLDFAGSGSNAQVFVISSGGSGTIAPSSVEQSNGVITIRFADGVCPGESSYFIGLVSSNRPATNAALVELTSGSNVVVGTRTPRRGGVPINCDFAPLRRAIEQLALRDILAPNDHAREGRRGALINSVEAASNAADEGDLMGVLDALEHLAKKTGNNKNSWIRESAAGDIRDALDTLLDCVEPHAAR